MGEVRFKQTSLVSPCDKIYVKFEKEEKSILFTGTIQYVITHIMLHYI